MMHDMYGLNPTEKAFELAKRHRNIHQPFQSGRFSARQEHPPLASYSDKRWAKGMIAENIAHNNWRGEESVKLQISLMNDKQFKKKKNSVNDREVKKLLYT